MFEKITPEQAGVSSRNIERMISFLERNGYVFHSLLLMKGDKLFGEYYWKPFDKDFCHRMYSQTKSYVGIAIGLLLEEGKLSLDDPIVKFFPEKIENSPFTHLAEQTVREMLTMRTAVKAPSWFRSSDPDRTHEYLNATEDRGPSGTIWSYDSAGSQVLCSLVEKLSGKSLFDYLNEKIFRHLGTFKTATILKTPNGDSWGDSALICTSRDMASFMRLLVKGGVHEGKTLINADYLKEATSKVVDNHENAFTNYEEYGYGYQIWQTVGGSFMFNGMGSQYGIGIPEKDIVFVINSDNQAHPCPMHIIIDRFFEEVVEKASDNPLPEDAPAHKELMDYSDSLELFSLSVGCKDNVASKVSGKEYITDDNPMGITKMKFTFEDDKCVWEYTNAQGDKKLEFGMGKNIYGVFPEEGYSDTVAATFAEGHYYKCASSASWTHPDKLEMLVQVIDKYFGRLHMRVAFVGEDRVAVSMFKIAEDFMNEYEGYVQGKSKF